MREWMQARPWWQELLMTWLLFSVSVLVFGALLAVTLGWTDTVPRNAFKFLTITLVWSVLVTPFARWRHRVRSSTAR
ncbi:hypothetical protein OHB54_44245 [Streptomyces sp. NBC_01007]|nr:hypothetical protein OHB54_44245 [Streptomyces sp. NBC_01007]